MTSPNPPVWLAVAKLLFHLSVFLLLLSPLALNWIEGPRPGFGALAKAEGSPLWQRHHLILLALASPPGFLLFMIVESLLPVPGGGVTALLLLLQAWRHRRGAASAGGVTPTA